MSDAVAKMQKMIDDLPEPTTRTEEALKGLITDTIRKCIEIVKES